MLNKSFNLFHVKESMFSLFCKKMLKVETGMVMVKLGLNVFVVM